MPTIFQVTSWLSSIGGGIPPVIHALSKEFHQGQFACVVAGLKDASGNSPTFRADVPVVSGRIKGLAAFGYSPDLARQLRRLVQKDSVIHAHGLWMYPGWLARQLSDASGGVRVVSPHGMLEPWALNHSSWKKHLAGWCFEKRNLQTASCLHALCPAEMENFRKYGLKNPVAVIPNGVEPAAFENMPNRAELEEHFPGLRGRRWMLFLSRIHPKKGLPHFIQAWSRLASRFPEWLLVIAGPDELSHEAEMKQLVADSGLTNSVCFTGPLHGTNKLAALNGAEVFVLPSFSEGFSMAILEAAAAGLPVLLTPHCNFPELARIGGGTEVSADVDGCEAGLSQLLSLSTSELRQIGLRGKMLVHGSYTWARAAQKMLEVYRWLAGGTPKPAFIACL